MSSALSAALGLYFLSSSRASFLYGEAIANDLARGVDDQFHGPGPLVGGDLVHLGVEVLGVLGQDAQPGGVATLSAAIVEREPARGLVGRQGILFALAQRDDVEIADVALKVAQRWFGVAHQLFVDGDCRADLALLFEALALPHAGGRGPAHCSRWFLYMASNCARASLSDFARSGDFSGYVSASS